MNAIDRIKEELWIEAQHYEDERLCIKYKKLTDSDFNDLMDYIENKAKKEKVNGIACIEDNDVYGWAFEWLMNYDPVKAQADRENAKKKKKEVKSKPKAKDKPKPVEKPKKAEIEPKKADIKVKQTDLFGWEK